MWPWTTSITEPYNNSQHWSRSSWNHFLRSQQDANTWRWRRICMLHNHIHSVFCWWMLSSQYEIFLFSYLLSLLVSLLIVTNCFPTLQTKRKWRICLRWRNTRSQVIPLLLVLCVWLWAVSFSSSVICVLYLLGSLLLLCSLCTVRFPEREGDFSTYGEICEHFKWSYD